MRRLHLEGHKFDDSCLFNQLFLTCFKLMYYLLTENCIYYIALKCNLLFSRDPGSVRNYNGEPHPPHVWSHYRISKYPLSNYLSIWIIFRNVVISYILLCDNWPLKTQKWLPYQILGSKTVNKVQIDPPTTDWQ